MTTDCGSEAGPILAAPGWLNVMKFSGLSEAQRTWMVVYGGCVVPAHASPVFVAPQVSLLTARHRYLVPELGSEPLEGTSLGHGNLPLARAIFTPSTRVLISSSCSSLKYPASKTGLSYGFALLKLILPLDFGRKSMGITDQVSLNWKEAYFIYTMSHWKMDQIYI